MSKLEAHNIEYNSEKELLIMPEYGRHVQEMINYAKSIEDKVERQKTVEKVISLMMQMAPQNKNLNDYRDKMWKHVFKIANYDLDVEVPNGVIPVPEAETELPPPPDYPVIEPTFRHYGHNVQELVRKAKEMEKGPIRDGFVETIGSYMKLAYKTWNKEHYVSDEIIIEDLNILSNGELEVIENAKLDELSKSLRFKDNRREKSSNNRNRSRNNRGNNSNKNKRRYRKKN